MKSISKLLLALSLASCFSVQAQAENQDLCYPLAHGENGFGSKNSMLLPTLVTGGPNWTTYLYFTNASDKPINVKLDFSKFDASPYKPYSYRYAGQFSAANSPLQSDSGVALLKPLETGRLVIYDGNSPHDSGFIGQAHWQADACLDSALRVDVRSVYEDGSRYSQGLVTLNGGNPF